MLVPLQFELTEKENEALDALARRAGKSRDQLLRETVQSLLSRFRDEEERAARPRRANPSGRTALEELRSDLTAW